MYFNNVIDDELQASFIPAQACSTSSTPGAPTRRRSHFVASRHQDRHHQRLMSNEDAPARTRGGDEFLAHPRRTTQKTGQRWSYVGCTDRTNAIPGGVLCRTTGLPTHTPK
jgi:hypothetical protein